MTGSQVFEVAPAAIKTGWLNLVMLLSIVVVAGVILFVYYAIASGKHARFEITGDRLVIHGGMYGRTIPLAELDLDRARVADLTEVPELTLKSRRNGLGLPGLKCGWFRLKNSEKALVFLTDPTRTAYVPTTGDYVLLFSLGDPMAFLEALKARAPKP